MAKKSEMNRAAAILAKRRAAKLSLERRKEIARKAALARWKRRVES